MTVLDPVTTPGQPIRVHLRSVGTTRNSSSGLIARPVVGLPARDH